MKTKIVNIEKNSDGFKKFSINVNYNNNLDLVEKVTGQNSFSEILETSFHNISWNNNLNLNSGIKLEYPIIEFIHLILNISPTRDEGEEIYSETLKGLEEELELKVLKSILKWNQDFIIYCIINLFPDLTESIDFEELSLYYLDNSKFNNEYFSKNLQTIFTSKKSKIDLLKEILSNLEALRNYEFEPDNYEEEEFLVKKPVENFITKLTGTYNKELIKYEVLKQFHIDNQEARKNIELEIIRKYKLLTLEFANPYIEIINEKIEYLDPEKELINSKLESIESRFQDLINKNVINAYYNFKYELFFKNDYLLLEIYLPSFEDFLNSKNKKLSKNVIKSLENEYRDICISIIFGLADVIFKNDNDAILNQLFFNGLVFFKDKSTGKQGQSCIISLSVSKEEFIEIDLNHIDLYLAFKRLKGISAPNISENISVRPIMSINKEDRRFVESKDIIQFVDERTNLASMDWEDFEHFIRELFEKEFSSSGGEVKITQSSRDGGIDAIAFDPDPIKGGKIVIQSKRYTNVVGVSAVRDLYGTMINEGANKGILVTTSHFGSDAYKFAKDKPLSLIDGDNLLNLLSKHNFKAKIDINEAREIKKKG